MTASKVRTDYESLKQIAQGFSQQADATRQTLQQIKQAMDALQQGDWVGKGADKFYGEMNAAVVPSVTRLQTALENASQVTTQISRVMKQAEDDAARVLRGDEAGGAPAGGAPGGSEGISTGQPVGPSGGSIGGSEGISTGQPVGPSGGSLSRSPASASTGAGGGTDATTSERLTALDPRVAEIAEMSPTLKAQLEQLKGWTIVAGTPGAGSSIDRDDKLIMIDPDRSPAKQVGSLAHEAAHALYGEPPYHAPTRRMTRDEFVRLNVDEHLRNEGNSTFNEALVRDEVLTAGGLNIGVSGIKGPEYIQVYEAYDAGTITREQAIEQMSVFAGDDLTSTTGETNTQYYSRTYEEYWDKNIAPGRKKP